MEITILRLSPVCSDFGIQITVIGARVLYSARLTCPDTNLSSIPGKESRAACRLGEDITIYDKVAV